jgi:gamma-glutamyl-gamma-aminobutyrate hydrolase PuuD
VIDETSPRAEIALTRDALAARVPLLGICRGMQVINIALGGTLHPDHSVLVPPGSDHPGGDWERWELQEECAPGGNGERILRLFLRHAARCRRQSIPAPA